MNGKFAGQLTVIKDQFRVADNILQVSNLSSKCLVIFFDHWGNSDFSFIRSNIIDITTRDFIIYMYY